MVDGPAAIAVGLGYAPFAAVEQRQRGLDLRAHGAALRGDRGAIVPGLFDGGGELLGHGEGVLGG